MTTSTSLRRTVQFYDLHPPIEDFCADVLSGLLRPQKSISPKFLYDKQGADLFDAICALDEYYLTRTEMAILRTNASEIGACIGNNSALIEFGSGSSKKVRILLDAMHQRPVYVGLDISKQHLVESCENLVEAYPGLTAIALCTDYTQPLQLPDIPELRHRRVGFFPGSSIGNLEPEEAIDFLKHAAIALGDGGSLLIGVDLKKSHKILEPAYDDAQGVSAQFALNLLTRINRELGANFDLEQFGYRAVYNAIAGRIEMYIVSLKAQTVHLNGVDILFDEGEELRTEYSYKYSISGFQQIAKMAGFQPQQVWTDPQNLFSIHHLQLS